MRRDRNAAEIRRLRRLPSRGFLVARIPSRAGRMREQWRLTSIAGNGLWWVREIAGITLVTLAIPTVALAYVSRRSGISWGDILSSIGVVLESVLALGALSITMIVGTMAALIHQHHVIAAAYALIMAVLLGAVTAAVVWMFFDGTAVTANRVVTVVCALWLYWAPAVITLRTLVVNPVGSGWFPGGMASEAPRARPHGCRRQRAGSGGCGKGNCRSGTPRRLHPDLGVRTAP